MIRNFQLYVLIFSLSIICNHSISGEVFQEADVEELEKVIDKFHKQKLLEAPAKVITEIRNAKSINYRSTLSESLSEKYLSMRFCAA
jgi:hypothetical protein